MSDPLAAVAAVLQEAATMIECSNKNNEQVMNILMADPDRARQETITISIIANTQAVIAQAQTLSAITLVLAQAVQKMEDEDDA